MLVESGLNLVETRPDSRRLWPDAEQIRARSGRFGRNQLEVVRFGPKLGVNRPIFGEVRPYLSQIWSKFDLRWAAIRAYLAGVSRIWTELGQIWADIDQTRAAVFDRIGSEFGQIGDQSWPNSAKFGGVHQLGAVLAKFPPSLAKSAQFRPKHVGISRVWAGLAKFWRETEQPLGQLRPSSPSLAGIDLVRVDLGRPIWVKSGLCSTRDGQSLLDFDFDPSGPGLRRIWFGIGQCVVNPSARHAAKTCRLRCLQHAPPPPPGSRNELSDISHAQRSASDSGLAVVCKAMPSRASRT